jgi:hypothetical protein
MFKITKKLNEILKTLFQLQEDIKRKKRPEIDLGPINNHILVYMDEKLDLIYSTYHTVQNPIIPALNSNVGCDNKGTYCEGKVSKITHHLRNDKTTIVYIVLEDFKEKSEEYSLEKLKSMIPEPFWGKENFLKD